MDNKVEFPVVCIDQEDKVLNLLNIFMDMTFLIIVILKQSFYLLLLPRVLI